MAGGDQRAVLCAAALSRVARRRSGAGGGRADAGGSGTIRYTPDFLAPISTANHSCRARCSAAAPAAAIMPTATMRSTSCRIRATSRRNSPKPGFPLLVEKLALRTDSGGAGLRRGGQGYEKHYRALVDCRTIVTRRSGAAGLLRPELAAGAGQPFCVTIDAEGEAREPWRPRRRRSRVSKARWYAW